MGAAFPASGEKKNSLEDADPGGHCSFRPGLSFYLHQMLKNTGPQEKTSNAGGGSPEGRSEGATLLRGSPKKEKTKEKIKGCKNTINPNGIVLGLPH